MDQKQQTPLLCLACLLLLQTCCFSFITSISSTSTMNRLNYFTDEAALLTFKSNVKWDPSHTLSNSWTRNTSFCNWIGVLCSRRRQRVTELDLHGMDLQGIIPPHISNLSFLVYLNLGYNNFHGSLPHELGHLHRLKVIDLDTNKLEGSIPPSLANLSELSYLALGNNNLRGNIPAQMGRLFNLQLLSFFNNSLSGEIPPVIFNISSLVHLIFSYNHFSGQLPTDTGRFLPNLNWLDIHSNQMSGNIPITLSNATKLVGLWLSKNNLHGSIPDTLGHLLHLEILNLFENNLTGTIPSNIFNISSLTSLSLFSNTLSGQLPENTGRFLPNLENLDISGNPMSGSIPISLSNASMLIDLHMNENNLNGSIPDTLGHLLQLEVLSMAENNLRGTIPASIFNLSYLSALYLNFNQLSGNLPPDIGDWLPNIDQLALNHNQLSGQLPLTLGNASKLSIIDVCHNNFSGPIPTTFGKLPLLRQLSMTQNQLINEPGTNELNFLTYLTGCRLLEALDISLNPLQGILPSSVGNFSVLEVFWAAECQIEGTIPKEFGNLRSLITLCLNNNNFQGTIPSTIGRLEKLQRLDLSSNKLQGFIPIELKHLRYIGELFLGWNMLSGGIPDLFQNLHGLQKISLENNKLLSRIPSSLWTLQDLRELYLSHNSLTGVLSQEVGNLKNLDVLDLSGNQFTGNIPIPLGQLQMLNHLDLSSNSLEGPIPYSFGGLISLISMDLSSNHLNGTIPKPLQILGDLEFLNLSFNSLEGEIPNKGVFAHLTAQSFIGNSKLCSSLKLHVKLNVSVCPIHETKSRFGSLVVKIIISTLIVTIFIVCFSLLIVYLRKKQNTSGPIENSPTRAHKMISYQELLHSTNNFSEENLIGVGNFGSVYKGIMVNGSLVAVKVLSTRSEEAWKSFDAECKVMRNIQHRNLVKIITSCSNPHFRALVLQFMPNGSLDQWLYSQNNYLSLLQRIGIMIDVASAMEYLHHHYSSPIVHCDLKPSNVLLDEDMVAHVGDFGISKLLDGNKATTRTNNLGTIGYVAPEYGLEGKVSIKGDVYSYGILLLEMLTRKKPTDNMFTADLSLRQWVNAAFPHSIMDVVDMNLQGEISNNGNLSEEAGYSHRRQLSCLLSIVEVGLLCSRELPEERTSMKDVVIRLTKIKKEILSLQNNVLI